MEEREKQAIINSGKDYFRKIIIPNHIKGLKSLRLKDFKINPFMVNYLAGKISFEDFAKALLYPVMFDTLVSSGPLSAFNQFVARLSELTDGFSDINGIDFEFTDAIDGKRKYCQCRPSLVALTDDETAEVLGNFKKAYEQSQAEGVDMQINDLVMAFPYGDENIFSGNSKIISSHYDILYGEEFWHRLSGDRNFYYRICKAFAEVIEEPNSEGGMLVKEKVADLAQSIHEQTTKYA